MKSLFKLSLLVTTMMLAVGGSSIAIGATESKPATATFKTEDEKTSYALGASLGRYMDNSLKEQEKLGLKADRAALLSGVQDAFAGKSKLNDQQVAETLQAFSQQMKEKAQARTEKEAKENGEKGTKFTEAFAKEAGVKTSTTGLLYKVEKAGEGDTLKDEDTVVVNYVGKLVDGTEFDNSYTRGEPVTFVLSGVIAGWSEGLKAIHKGGKIKLVIPPALAYGEQGVPGSIPPNATLVFDVELLDVNPQPKDKVETPEVAPAENKDNADKKTK